MAKKKTNNKTKNYSEDEKQAILDIVCGEMEMGRSVREIFVDEKLEKELPNRSTFMEWTDKEGTLSDQYARARKHRNEFIFDRKSHNAHTPMMGETTKTVTKTIDGKETVEVTVTVADMLGHRRLMNDADEWMLGKLDSVKYGNNNKETGEANEININIINGQDLPDEKE